MFFHVFFCIIGIIIFPEFISCIVIERISLALSPISCNSFANEHIWHPVDLHVEGWREAKSLVNISFPGLCRSSIERVLNPVKNALILELVENALRLRLHASTHG